MRRRRMLLLGVVWACCLWLPVRPGASQDQPTENTTTPVAPSNDVAPPVPSNEAVPPGPPMEALPLPPEDVMRPTRHGLRLTPGMVKLGARAWLQDGPFGDVGFDERQQADLSQKFSRRVMEAANRYGEQVRGFLETYFESMLGGGKNMTAEVKQGFGQQGADLVPAMRDLIKDFARDARPLLTNEQWELFKNDLRREFQNVERAENNLKRWAQGGAKEDEGLDDLDLEGYGSGEGDGRPGPGASPRAGRTLRDARRRADAEMRWLGLASAKEFLASAKAFFKLNDAQMARGEQLLAEYRHRAEPIMTAQWHQRLHENRVKYNLRWTLNREGLQPWVFHLESEYNELVGPLKELESEFRDRVIALATPEQRDAAIGTLRERAAQHGLQFTELDTEVLRMLPE